MTDPRATEARPRRPAGGATPEHNTTSTERTPVEHNSGAGDWRDDWRRDWRGTARRRWPLLAVIAVALAVAVWAIAGRGSPAPDTSAETEHDETAVDSVVTLDSTAQRLAGIEFLTAGTAASDALVANGTITFDANRVSVISPRAEGRIVSVRADLGQEVRAGAVLALLESSEVGQTRGELERARANVDVARRNYEREKRLFEQSISPQRELLEAEAEYRSAQADYNSALASLRALGASGGEGATFGLASSINGTIVERNANPGQIVGPEVNLFTVGDVRHVWITVDVYEGDLSRVRQGATATVMPTALPGESFTGRVTYAGGVVDTASRTFKVRVELENPGLRLRPGMFAQVRIAAPPAAAGSGSPITIPEIAVQDINGKQVVFVAKDTTGQFVTRPVALGPRAAGGMVTVTSGLRPGERIVGKGAFQLKAEMLKASFEEGGH